MFGLQCTPCKIRVAHDIGSRPVPEGEAPEPPVGEEESPCRGIMSAADAMDAILTEARTAPVEALPGLIGQLAMAQATAMARLTTPASVISTPMPDELISITAAAVRLGVSRNFLYRKASTLPFSRRMGRKLVFSTNGIEAYITKAR